MRSPRTFLGAAALLLALPIAALYQALFVNGAGAVIHLLLATGVFLVSTSVGDFRLPGWMQWSAGLSNGALGGLFLLQALGDLTANRSVNRLAYEILGQRVEAWLVSLFLLWCIALLVIDSRGTTRTLGFIAVAVVIAIDGYSYLLSHSGSSLNAEAPGLKILYLLLPAWLLLASRARVSDRKDVTPAPARSA